MHEREEDARAPSRSSCKTAMNDAVDEEDHGQQEEHLADLPEVDDTPSLADEDHGEQAWDYFELPAWRLRDHSEFPAHLRAQIFAVAVSLSDMHIAPVLELIAKGIDALKRKRALEF